MTQNVMTQNAAMNGEKVYEQELDLIRVTDFGVSMDDSLLARKRSHCREPDLTLRLMDAVRDASRAGRTAPADGRMELDLHLTIETDDGRRIALSGDGQAAPRNGEPILDIFGNIRLSTASKEYAWVNERQIWTVGTANLSTGKIHIEAFRQ